MKELRISIALSLTIACSVFAVASANCRYPEQDFLHCLENSGDPSLKEVIYTPNNTDFLSVLNFYVQNLRFMNEETPKPNLIVAPFKESQVQTVVRCGKGSGLQMRVRSGGHDFEGSSYISDVPFFVLDINKFRSISIDDKNRTVWFGAGATLGEIYYDVYKKNSSLGVALGNWPTVCVGGYISGGGYGGLTRQYGMGADQVIDAIVVDAYGEIHDRKSMGEDFFWAIRGGIGANFGVILAYKLNLVQVPEKAAVFYVSRTLEENAIQLAHKWQIITRTLPLDLSFSIVFAPVISNQTGKLTVQASFVCAYRGGGVDELLSIVDESFPELGVTKGDVFEILWVQYTPFHNRYPLEDYVHYLTSRIPPTKQYLYAKSDFVKDPIPESGIEELLHKFADVSFGTSQVMEWTFWGGGIMDKIPESEIAFPHRGYLYFVFEGTFGNETDTPATIEERINWIRGFHSEFGHYVPNNPRPAYADYRDHDLGVNSPDGTTTVEQARKTWGGPYFGRNFDRLVRVKSQVDPDNFFRNEQGFPVLKSPRV